MRNFRDFSWVKKMYKDETKTSLDFSFPDVVVLLRILLLHLHFLLFHHSTSAGRFRWAQCISHELFLLTSFIIRVGPLVIFLNHSNFLLMQKVVPFDLSETQRTTSGSLTSPSHYQKQNLFLMSFRNILNLI